MRERSPEPIAVRRPDEFAPIGWYAGLGDGRTVALVARDGRIDWWPLPTLDSPPVFAALIDPVEGGYLAMAPEGPFRVSRRYVEDTNVLETTFRTDAGSVRVTDALAVGRNGRLPWAELIRSVQGLDGEVDMAWRVVPGTRFRSAKPWIEQRGGAQVIHVADQLLALRCFDVGPPEIDGDRVQGRFRTSSSETGWLAVVSSDREPLFLPGREALEDHLRLTGDRWRDWAAAIRYRGEWNIAVRRSALALKLLIYTPGGAVAAAATTSLPERIGGTRNFDYRYMWIRDASFAINALMDLGLEEEVQGAVSWLLSVAKSTAPDLHVFYKLDGTIPDEQVDLDVPGYRGSRPVRSGNGAMGQLQLDSFGELFDMVWRYVGEGHVLDQGTERLLSDLADRCCEQWSLEDDGLWELPVRRHYTISKMGCWVALDRACRLLQKGFLDPGRGARWAAERAAIRRWVHRHCWSERKRSYTFYAGTDDLDAATLLCAWNGFDRGDRLAGTVAAVQRELSRGPLVFRYSGMQDEEGAFLACSFWLVNALVVLDRLEEARRLMEESLSHANDVGLMSEELDPDTGDLLGNVPQALTHLALINAATAFSMAATRSGGGKG